MGMEEPDMREARNVDISDFTLYDPDHANTRRIYITGPCYLSNGSASGVIDLTDTRFILIVSPHFLQLPEKNFLIRLS
jgi:hypothetical protein